MEKTAYKQNTKSITSRAAAHRHFTRRELDNSLKASPLLQCKLTIGKSNDKYEQEADRIADQVMRMPEAGFVIQRACSSCQEEELQTKPQFPSITPLIQRQPLEEEEEPVQARLIQRQPEEEEEEPIQAKLSIQRQVEDEDELVQAKLIQKQEYEEGGGISARERQLDQQDLRIKHIQDRVNDLEQRIEIARNRIDDLTSKILSATAQEALRRVKIKVEKFNPNQPDKTLEIVLDETRDILDDMCTVLFSDGGTSNSESVNESISDLRIKYSERIESDANAFTQNKTRKNALKLIKLVEAHQSLGGEQIESDATEEALEMLRVEQNTNEGQQEIQPKYNPSGKQRESTSIGKRLGQSRGQGFALPESTRSFMESRFGVDFGEVRIHNDTNSLQLNRQLNAQAFTSGRDIYFNSGRYNPETSHGKHLLAHELTHVIQQKRPVKKPETTPQIQRRIEVAGRNLSLPRGQRIIGVHRDSSALLPIMRRMILVPGVYDLANNHRLVQLLVRRLWLIRQMARINASGCCGYPRNRLTPRVNSSVRTLWEHIPRGGNIYRFRLNSLGRASAPLAVAGLFAPQSNRANKTLLDCTHMIGALHYYSRMRAIGNSRFQNLVRSGRIVVDTAIVQDRRVAPATADRLYQSIVPRGVDELVPGDHVYFSNHRNYSGLMLALRGLRRERSCPTLPANCQDVWVGEHAVYIGFRRIGTRRRFSRVFQGHGTTRKTEQQMKRVLRRHYNCHARIALNRCNPPVRQITYRLLRRFYSDQQITRMTRQTGLSLPFDVRQIRINEVPGLRNPSDTSRMRFIRYPIAMS